MEQVENSASQGWPSPDAQRNYSSDCAEHWLRAGKLPGRMARRAHGTSPLVDAAASLLPSADPARREEVIDAAKLSAGNRDEIDRFRVQTQKIKSPTY